MKLLALFVLVCIPRICLATTDPWTMTDTALVGVLVLESAYDVGNTNYNLHHCKLAEERDLLLGRHPSFARLAVSGAAANALLIGAEYFLPTDWRRVVQTVSLTIETFNLALNAEINYFYRSYGVSFGVQF